MAAASLDIKLKEELNFVESQMEAKLASMNLKLPGLKSTMPGFPSARTSNTSTTNRQSLAFSFSSSFLPPDTANTVGNPSDAAATLARQRAKLNAAHRISAGPFIATQPRQYAPRLQLSATPSNDHLRRPS
ncbi:hypothetical protein EDB87DRAFT_1198642 [Lactarius vividus]|nr:hypothetical protein EDB87DRAFT_1198642 [Lactarius vividus]